MILASASPRRRELLADEGFEFAVCIPSVKEVFPRNLTLREITTWNALRKGLAVARAHPEGVVLAADTLVGLDHEVIGKPADLKDARRILRRLSGRTHTVASGVFLGHLARGRTETFTVVSEVYFKKWGDREI
ncbi:MAG: Maf family protein, partial [Chthoniobacterales bacterium]